MFLLDTNVVSELRKTGSDKINGCVAAWVSRQRATGFYISTVTLLELEIGVLQIERRDKPQGAVLRAWLEDRVLPAFTDRILPIDSTVSLRCASLHVPDPRPERDAWIAATALVHGMTLVTRNVVDFEPMGVPLLNPWTSSAF